MRKLFLGILIGALVVSYHPVLAEGLKEIMVSITNVNITFNGEPTTDGDTYYNGKTDVPLALNYEGTTYIPLRYFSETFGKKVSWVSTTSTIDVSDLPSDSHRNEENQDKQTKNGDTETSKRTDDKENAIKNDGTLIEIDDLKDRTIYDVYDFTNARFQDIYFLGAASHFELLSEYVRVQSGASNENFRKRSVEEQKRLISNGVVYFHILNQHEFDNQDNYYLPLNVEEINKLLEEKKSFIYPVKKDGAVQLLIAARDNVE